MKVALLVLLVACSKSSGSVDCEALKAKYMAVSEHNVTDAVATMEAGSARAEIEAQGKKELAMANERFIGACKALGDKVDAACFETDGDKAQKDERKKRCKDLRKELDHRLYQP